MELNFKQFEAICNFYCVDQEEVESMFKAYLEWLGINSSLLGHESVYIVVCPDANNYQNLTMAFSIRDSEEQFKGHEYFNYSKHLGINVH